MRIDLLFGDRRPRRCGRCGRFQYPRADRLVVGGCADPHLQLTKVFQYPRADRLVVGGDDRYIVETQVTVSVSSCGSTCCWGQLPRRPGGVFRVSVSSCGSTCSWGALDRAWMISRQELFQYPRADRLVLGEIEYAETRPTLPFQYPRADRLVFGDSIRDLHRPESDVSVSSCGSTCFWGQSRMNT